MPVKYLGVPLISTRLKKEHCTILIDRSCARINSLKSSYAGRLQLINSILRSMQVYWCSIFVLPKSVVLEIDKKCKALLWQGKEQGSKSLVSLHQVCLPKKEGGLGIKDIVSWNKAAVGKKVWDLPTHKQSLWAVWINRQKLKKLSFWGYY